MKYLLVFILVISAFSSGGCNEQHSEIGESYSAKK